MTPMLQTHKIISMIHDEQEPWYEGGLKFRCTQCGDCCTGAPGYVWVNDDEMRAIADHLNISLAEFVAMHTYLTYRGRTLRERSNGDCVFYEQQVGCTIYPVRPGQCRTWPFWESNLKTPADWKRTCSICPGSGQGDLIPVSEITRRLNVIQL